MKRSPLRRLTRLKPVSERRKAQADVYLQARMVVFARDGWCQAPSRGYATLCYGGLDPHHVYPTSRFPERRCDPEAQILLCRGHHSEVHDRPVYARAMGLLV